MKKLAIFIFVLSLMSSPSFATAYDFMFHADFLESANPGGWSYSLKTFEDEYILNVGDTVEFDIWVHDVPLYEGILSAGLWIEYNPTEITLISVDVYDGVHGHPGPWDPGFTNIVADPYYTDAYAVYTAAFYPCALPDSDEDLIIAKVSLYSSAPGDTSITFKHIPGTFEPTLWGCDVVREYWAIPHTITIHQEISDSDADGIPDHEDNCPNDYNPDQNDSEFPSGDGIGDVCDNCPEEDNPLQEDNFPPQGNGIGDACDCEGNFDGDEDVDGSEAALFKFYFGRSEYNTPCTIQDPCNGDFDCDSDVDGNDAARFKTDFGRSRLYRMCQEVVTDPWCIY